jgi:hypothetical protein
LSGEDRDIFLHTTNGRADYVYFTAGNGKDKTIKVIEVLTYEEARKQVSDPCAYVVSGKKGPA